MLSEHEARVLARMEFELRGEDPHLADDLRKHMPRSTRRHLWFAAGRFMIGIALLLAGPGTGHWPVGLLGFLVMFISAWDFLSEARGTTRPQELTDRVISGLDQVNLFPGPRNRP